MTRSQSSDADHGSAVLLIWRCNQTRAVAQSRSTVAREMPSTCGYFGSRQSPEELHFHDLSLSLVDARQLVQGVVQSQEFGISVDGQSVQVLEGDPASAVTFVGPAFAGVVHQDLTHEARGNGNEMRAVLQFHRLTSQQPQVGLVDQRRALQGVIRALGLEVVVRQAPQLFVDQRHQTREELFRRPASSDAKAR